MVRSAGIFALAAMECFGAADARLVDAVKQQNFAAVRDRIAAHADVNGAEPDGFTALHWAAQRNDLQSVNLLIDAGANPDSDAHHMVQFAIMGSIYARYVLSRQNPRVGLMSIGEEDTIGNETTKEAFKLLKRTRLNFYGNIEGFDLFANPVDVVVCDGFTGNVVLKTAEAAALAIFASLKHQLFKNPIRKLGASFAKGAFQTIRRKMNPDTYGGSQLLGVNGICIIAHGASSPLAVKNAIRAAADSIKYELNPQITKEIEAYEGSLKEVGAGS